jgi:hypothetical protein
MSCPGRHTKYQPTDEEFRCPHCGKGPKDNPQGLVIEENNDESVSAECPQLHVDDYLRCYACDYEDNGRAYANRLAKKKDLVPCPCCKGKGMVPSKEVKRWKAR